MDQPYHGLLFSLIAEFRTSEVVKRSLVYTYQTVIRSIPKYLKDYMPKKCGIGIFIVFKSRTPELPIPFVTFTKIPKSRTPATEMLYNVGSVSVSVVLKKVPKFRYLAHEAADTATEHQIPSLRPAL